jgi:hypothetical protein
MAALGARPLRRDPVAAAVPFARGIDGRLAHDNLEASRAVPGVCRREVRSSVPYRVSGWYELVLTWFRMAGADLAGEAPCSGGSGGQRSVSLGCRGEA